MNRIRNVLLEPVALAERNDSLCLTYRVDEDFCSTPSVSGYAVEGQKATIVVPACSLDSYLTKLGRVPDLIKIDVEGAEMGVLRGAKTTLREARPKILVEIHRWGTPESGEVARFLYEFGYRGEVLGERAREAFVLFRAEDNFA